MAFQGVKLSDRNGEKYHLREQNGIPGGKIKNRKEKITP